MTECIDFVNGRGSVDGLASLSLDTRWRMFTYPLRCQTHDRRGNEENIYKLE